MLNLLARKLSVFSAAAILTAQLFAVSSVYAESEHEAHQEEGGHHGYHKNVIGIFGGVTHDGRRENDPALGLEYERRITESFGLGAIAEYTFSDHDFWIYAISFAYHNGPWKLYVAPGIEDSDHHGSEELVRLGVEYAFELGGGWEIAPQVNVDFVDSEDVWVFGLVFAKGF